MSDIAFVLAKTSDAYGIAAASDHELRTAIEGAEQAAAAAMPAGEDAAPHMVIAMACYAERDRRRRVRPPYVDTRALIDIDGTPCKLSFMIRVF